MLKIGQNFMIKSLQYEDDGEYKCVAKRPDDTLEVTLVKGNLVVSAKKHEFTTDRWVTPGNYGGDITSRKFCTLFHAIVFDIVLNYFIV